MAVIIYQPTPKTIDFNPLPFYSLAKLDATYYKDAGSCEMCKRGVPAEKVWPTRLLLSEPRARVRFLSDEELANLLKAAKVDSAVMHAAIVA